MKKMQEKTLKLWKLNIHYKLFWEIKKDSEIILILHGWWGKSDSWITVGEWLHIQWFTVVIPDLPGFWKTKMIAPLTLEEYAIIIENFINELKIKTLLLWWHSNGGAISIKLANRNKISISRLILNNSAWIRNDKKRTLKRKLFKHLSKIFHSIPSPLEGGLGRGIKTLFYKLIWNTDYINTGNNPNLRQTYLNMIQTDLQEEIKKIKQNTLIIWGEKDTYTPLSDGLYMRKNIKNSKMIILENETHWIHLKNPTTLVNTFINNI
jgi:pimeloyl-ACP methyl ester carboxylesterase